MPLGLFERFGVELEYMIVDSQSLSVKPVTDQVLKAFAGEITDEIENGEISWSNELVMHVIELKTTDPAPALSNLSELFSANVQKINALLEPLGGKLLPSAMHPFMNPDQEMKIWPHGSNEIYSKYDQIFNCKGHGWSNLQSVHLNLPFKDDQEFSKLHAAIRVVLPLLPMLAASSPIMERKITGVKDTRLEVYRQNQKKIPSIAGEVIPEAVFSKADYEEKIFKKIYKDISPYDPEGTLQDEWLNSRGAIARFQRNAIEIRVLDIQECPKADLAILTVIVEVLKALIAEKWETIEKLKDQSTADLAEIFVKAAKDAEDTVITDISFLRIFGYPQNSVTGAGLWAHIIGNIETVPPDVKNVLQHILTEGSLSTRIVKSLNNDYSLERIKEVYNKLSVCLQNNTLFSNG
ncbi:MAG TPA: glutamate-cysteine ligase family protein [Cytophagales bacterium]|nr:glutamate-cysteine ligase family protein [Cytophagales bacterium]